MKLTHVYDLGPDPRRQVWEGPFVRHEGTIKWCCLRCGEEGSGSFKTVTGREEIYKNDLDDVLALAEAEHALRCSGSVSLVGFRRSKYVQYSRADVSFGTDGIPKLFMGSAERWGPGRYEDLTIYEVTNEATNEAKEEA